MLFEISPTKALSTKKSFKLLRLESFYSSILPFMKERKNKSIKALSNFLVEEEPLVGQEQYDTEVLARNQKLYATLLHEQLVSKTLK